MHMFTSKRGNNLNRREKKKEVGELSHFLDLDSIRLPKTTSDEAVSIIFIF